VRLRGSAKPLFDLPAGREASQPQERNLRKVGEELGEVPLNERKIYLIFFTLAILCSTFF